MGEDSRLRIALEQAIAERDDALSSIPRAIKGAWLRTIEECANEADKHGALNDTAVQIARAIRALAKRNRSE